MTTGTLSYFIKRMGKWTIISSLLLLLVLLMWCRTVLPGSLHCEVGRLMLIGFHQQMVIRLLSAAPIFGDLTSINGSLVYGLGAYKMTYQGGYHYSVSIPFWLLAVGFAVLPALAVRRLFYPGTPVATDPEEPSKETI